MANPSQIFDSVLVRTRQARALRGQPAEFLLERCAHDAIERLQTVQREFATIADIATPTTALSARLASLYRDAQIVRVGARDAGCAIVGEAEHLPLAECRFDLAVSLLALQAANDLPGALIQIRRALKPDGLFLGAIMGGRTLAELRVVLAEAEAEISGGASPRVAPFADVRDMGGLLQRAGFALPVADSDVLTVRYRSLFALMADLRAMGATNSLVARSRRPTARRLFLRAADLYAQRFADPDGRVRATFEIISLSGWAPDASQAKPARPGSGRISLARVLNDRSASLQAEE